FLGHIIHHGLAKTTHLMRYQNANAMCRQSDSVNPVNAAVMDLYLKAKPVCAEQTSRGIEAGRSGNGTGKIIPRKAQQMAADLASPGHASHQRIIQVLLFQRKYTRDIAKLYQLQQYGRLGKVGDDQSGLCGGRALETQMKLGRPLALKLLMREFQCPVSRMGVTQGR